MKISPHQLRLARAPSLTGIGLMGRAVFLAVILPSLMVRAAAAQTVSEPSVTLAGNHPFEAASFAPVSHHNPSAQLNMQVTLGLRNRGELDKLLRDRQNPASPRYHQWLTPAQFAARFGPSQQDLDAVVQWLNAQGLRVTAASLAQRYVRFSGAVADAERAFGTNIMAFGDGSAYSNITDPAVPARFSGVISAVGGLDNFLHSMAFSHLLPISRQTSAAASGLSAGPPALDSGPAPPMPQRRAISPVPDVNVGGTIAFGPSDVYSFYDETPLLSGGINGGGGDCLAIVGDSDFTPSAVALFNSHFKLPPSNITTVLVDGANPGIGAGELEALLDLEWTHAIAPGAATRFYLGDPSNSTANGPVVDGIQGAVNDDACGSIGVSFGLCGGSAAFYTETVSPIYAQAAAQGQSIFIASGDNGAAGIVLNPGGTKCVAGTTRNISELGGDPNVTDVGGTFFTPNVDASGNNVGDVTESAWNAVYPNPTPPPDTMQLATSGGASAFYPKPTNPPYQTGPGVPADGARDVPDISMIAAINNANGPGVFVGNENLGTPFIDCCFVGTSLSAQIWSGIAKLIAQLNGHRLGPLNPRIYGLANAGLATSGFRDVTTGNNDFGGVTGFSAGPGYDQTTGWGTVDITTFANKFVATPTSTPTSTATPSPTTTPSPHQTASPVPVLPSNSHSSGGGSAAWLTFFGLVLGWSLIQLLRNLLLMRDE